MVNQCWPLVIYKQTSESNCTCKGDQVHNYTVASVAISVYTVSVFYRMDSWTLTVVHSLSKPEEDHKTVIETVQNKFCLRTTVKVRESIL